MESMKGHNLEQQKHQWTQNQREENKIRLEGVPDYINIKRNEEPDRLPEVKTHSNPLTPEPME